MTTRKPSFQFGLGSLFGLTLAVAGAAGFIALTQRNPSAGTAAALIVGIVTLCLFALKWVARKFPPLNR